jgi:putative phage-type endonuclease
VKAPVALALRQRTDEWREARRGLITATDIPILMGLSPYRSEAALAREKLGGDFEPENLAMRIGAALEPVIKDEYERRTGATLRRFHGMVRHPEIEWAAASPDWRLVGERKLVEGKRGDAKRWQSGELPQDVEAQARWQMGVAGYPACDVAALIYSDLKLFTVEHDEATFADLVTIAADFRQRLAAGGPFAENAASIKARYPADDGSELVADAEIEEAVLELLRLRAQKADVEAACERIETAVKSRMGEHARLVGSGFAVTWKRTKDSTSTDWKAVADGLLRQLPETERIALVGLFSTVRPGFRPLRVQAKGATE